MKKRLFFGITLLAALTFASCGKKAPKSPVSEDMQISAAETPKAVSHRAEIEEFLKGYEQVCLQAEKAAKSKSMLDLLSLAEKAEKLESQSKNVEAYDDFTTADAAKLTDYAIRLTKALETTANSADSLNLGAFGF